MQVPGQVLMKEFAEGEAALPSTALRFFNVYGPRQDPANPYSGVISLFMEKGGLSKDVTILGDGEQTRDFVFVKDVARAIATALFQDEVNAYFQNPKLKTRARNQRPRQHAFCPWENPQRSEVGPIHLSSANGTLGLQSV